MVASEPNDDARPVHAELTDGLLTLTLHRPERHNALDDVLKRELALNITHAASDAAVRAVLLRGAGPSFCAGGDLRRIDSATPADAEVERRERSRAMYVTLHEVVLPLLGLEKPVVCAVHGHVIGAAVGLALTADFVLAAHDTRFAVPFADFALPPDMLTGYLLTRAVGIRRARQLLLRPRVVPADEAFTIGLVSEVVPAADLTATAIQVSRELANGPTLAYGRIKRQTALALTMDPVAFAAIDASDHGDCAASADYAEAVRARREQRSPAFVGA
jgi:2-(1,2-epoxy-1,2-dihydrophenyl)acetyl-CoA isomerase